MPTYIDLIKSSDTAGSISSHIMHPSAAGATGFFWQFATDGPALTPKATVPIGTFSGSGIVGTSYNQAESSNATGVQLAPGKVAFMLNGPDTPLDPDPGARFWSVAFSLAGRNAFPWAGGRELRFGCTEKFGSVGSFHPKVVGYTSCGLWLRDTSTGVIINFGFTFWDSRPGYNPPAVQTGIAYGPRGEVIPHTGGTLSNPSPLVTALHNEFNTGTGVGGKSYIRFGVITGANLLAVIRELRTLGNTSTNPAARVLRNLSLNPANYLLNSFNIQPEIAWDGGAAALPTHPVGGYKYLPMNLGVSYSDLSLFSYGH